MELSPEGLAAAAATRQAARKRAGESAVVAVAGANANKRAQGPGGRPPATCTHEVAVPEGFDVENIKLDPVTYGTLEEPRYSGPRAKQYPFTLDPFQETSVACLERRESVLVSAHTSAGKTVVAEYAIAMAFRSQQRVIYTSPLKALSNQKFRELSEAFGGDVGLMTGDVSLNPNASCIVMTTEILRSMIYRGSELLREVAWVVFDEIHYMQDRERGVVWEETIIFLDHHTKMVFLSATLSNASQFAAWVAHLHRSPCHVVYTDYRPTPLQHYAYALGGKGLWLLLDERGNFRADNFGQMREQIRVLQASSNKGGEGEAGDGGGGRDGGGRGGRGGRGRRGGRGGRGGGRGGRGDGQMKADMRAEVANILAVIKGQHWEPVIFFSFARRDCEQYANALLPRKGDGKKGKGPRKEGGGGEGEGKGAEGEAGEEGAKDRDREADRDGEGEAGGEGGSGPKEEEGPNFDFNTPDEKAQVEEIYHNALQCLSEADRVLKPISRMLPLLRRGIGVHHSGLLPILKELIEILFQEGLLKVLFTTETFAMGLNMPARCVVFTAMRKWDGAENRFVSSGEYIQMSGRAGRRGMDDRGLAVMMLDETMEEDTCRGIMQGKPSPLISSFKLTYYTMLNMLRRLEGSEAGTMEFVIRHSFQQFQQEANIPKLEQELKDIETEVAALGREGEEAMSQYLALRQQIEAAGASLQELLTRPGHVLPFLRAGRLVAVRSGGVEWGTGVVVSCSRRPDAPPAQEGQEDDRDAYLVDVLLSLDAASLEPPPAAAASTTTTANGQPSTANDQPTGPRPAASPGAPGSVAEVVPVTLSCLSQLHSLRISVPPDLRPAESRRQVMVQVAELLKRHGESGLPRLDPVEDMDVKDPQLPELVSAIEALEAQLARNAVHKAAKDMVKFAPYLRRAALDVRAEAIRQEMRTSQLASFRDEAACRTQVLRRLGHIDDDNVVTLKGRAACEIDTADELLASELLLNGTFSGLDHAQLVALASCLVPVEKSSEQIRLTAQMAQPLAALQAAARHIAEVSRECKLELDPDEYVEGFKPALMDVIYAWSKGASFEQVCEMTDIFEGTLVRATRRLDELLGQLANAAAAVGDVGLAEHIRAAAETIRRDIMFAASLYI
ncbi:hypothetical protein HYH03_015197 [Edaphochlamys debaryana]|uniref:Uncharacterized protein n=1 Tax=Edaphochlamys debaryana TaxID=47281 RepID=A0A836BRG2_9CHLO|nr:hypothetical protein HYH03_015197 [Edaphochlamys debaryana]|eukprot:KAG2486102.1 hypothetical protein HYH03_015197 [Edaphochlamys debaryana]